MTTSDRVFRFFRGRFFTLLFLALYFLVVSPDVFAQVAVTSGGAGASSANTNTNNMNGGAATGLGCGGGGAGYYGGNGGAGLYGGGGGGAAGLSATQYGGTGGQGVVMIAYYNGASFVSSVLLTSGTSVTVASGITSAKVWAIGAGGGGAGSTSNDGNSGGAGGAGGVSYVTKTVASGNTISYSLGVAGAYGGGTSGGSAGGNTSVTITGTTIYGNGGGGGYYNDGLDAPGGSYSGGDGGSTGGAGKGAIGDRGGGGGGGIGGVASGIQLSEGGTGANAVDVSGLFAACSSANIANPPVVTSFTPTTGSTGTSITITGSGFSGVTAVTFGGTAASSYTVNSGTQITATVGTGSSGSAGVTNAYGTGTGGTFTFTGINNHILGLGTQRLFTATGSTQSWTVPAGTTNIQVITIGGGGSGGAAYWAGGGGGGGALAYKTNLTVAAGNSVTVYPGRGGTGVSANSGGQGTGGESSYLTYSATTITACGGTAGTGTNSNTNTPYAGGAGGSPANTYDGGGMGGTGGTSSGDTGGGGGGAGGYTGKGGNGGWAAGSGGAGAGGTNGGNNGSNGAAQSGGGTGTAGPGTNGTYAGTGGSGGANGSANATAGGSSYTGGTYGGGGGGQSNDSKSTPGCNGGNGAVAVYYGYTATYGNAPVTLAAKATSGLPVTYSTSDPLVATVSGNILTITGAGTCTIHADQAGNGTYPAAIRVSQTLTVASSYAGITTAAVTSVAATTATCGGTVTTSGGNELLARGVCWRTTSTPTIDHSKTTNGATTGSFSSSLTGLTVGTTYYVRAYATNTHGTSYGQQFSFTTFELGAFPDINKTYGNPAFVLVNPTSGSPGAFSYGSSNTDVATIVGNTVTITGAGTSTITVTQAASGSYGSASKTALLTDAKAEQVLTLTIPTSAPLNTFIGTSLAITATSSAGLSVTITLGAGTTATATLNGTIGNYTLSGVGSTGIIAFKADQSGNENFNAASVSQSFNVEKNNQQIAFEPDFSLLYTYSPTLSIDLTGSATASSSLTVGYTIISGPGSLAGNTLNISGAGVVVIQASQAGNGSWNPAPPVSVGLTINKATPLISDFSAVNKTWGDSPFTLGATSNSPGTLAYSSENTGVAIISGNTVTIVQAGTSNLSVNQDASDNFTSASATVLLTVTPADQTITISSLPDISLMAFVGAPVAVTASSTSGLTVSLSVGGGSVASFDESYQLVSSGATGTVTVNATQAGNTNYNSASGSVSFTVSKLNQTITFGELISRNMGDPPFNLDASSTSSLDVSFASSNTDVATITGKAVTIVGSGNSTITATQSGDTYYNAATPATQLLTIVPCSGAVNPAFGGTIGSNQDACTSLDPALLSNIALPTGHTGTLDYKWQQSITSSSGGFSDIDGSNSDAYDPSTVTKTTWYKRLARVTCMSNWTGAAESNVVEVTIRSGVPGVPGTITGGATACAGTTGLTYSIAAVSDATFYTWVVPEEWAVTAGGTNISITVTAGPGGHNGNITVTAGNTCGSGTAASKEVTASPATVGGTVKW